MGVELRRVELVLRLDGVSVRCGRRAGLGCVSPAEILPASALDLLLHLVLIRCRLRHLGRSRGMDCIESDDSPDPGQGEKPCGTDRCHPGSNVVDVYIRYLRRKIDDPFPVKLLETLRGSGYRLRALDGS
jgi:Transcriptional regulatory protein, C terminal